MKWESKRFHQVSQNDNLKLYELFLEFSVNIFSSCITESVSSETTDKGNSEQELTLPPSLNEFGKLAID
jgi:hypothetical protein